MIQSINKNKNYQLKIIAKNVIFYSKNNLFVRFAIRLIIIIIMFVISVSKFVSQTKFNNNNNKIISNNNKLTKNFITKLMCVKIVINLMIVIKV